MKAGIALTDWEDLTVGFIEDIIIASCRCMANISNGYNDSGVVDATQEDFDRF